MKKVIAIAAALLTAAFLCACGSEPAAGTPAGPVPDSSASPSVTVSAGPYKDGTYQYRGKKDSEWYHVEATMVISNGAIQSMEWFIVDENKDRVFDETYEEVYGYELYIQQCRDNWKGMQTFVPALLETQDPDEVDAVSGATWAYDKFEEAAKALLEQAKK